MPGMASRSPICTVLGHVDHGKSSLLDAIRRTNITATEAGGITQAIGASIIPLEVIKARCGPLLSQMSMAFTIPGLLFIDTPGHAAFTSLRRRGGSLADLAVLVIDINEGFRPQTLEAIEILRGFKTPFVVAANKIDLLAGYRKAADNFLSDFSKQSPSVQQMMETKLYELVGAFYERCGLAAERFDRVDFTKQIAIIPCSAKQYVGIPELLMVLTGLAQKYLEARLKVDVDGPGKGTILEVKEERGLGLTLDVILYDGTLQVQDTVVIGGLEAPLVTKVRALLLPEPLAEMRDRRARFHPVRRVTAATGVKLSCPDLTEAIAGMPLQTAAPDTLEAVKAALQAEVQAALIQTDKQGVLLKADTLGSLEALTVLLRGKGIPIRRASVGPITKKDVSEAEASAERDPQLAVVLGFNVPPHSSSERVRIITGDVIYTLLEQFDAWQEEVRARQIKAKINLLVRPAKIEVLRNCVFRQSNPCIVGVEVLEGTLRPGVPLMKDGMPLAAVKSMQAENQSVGEAGKGKQVAISLFGVTAGRQIAEGDILHSDIPEDEFRQLKEAKGALSGTELAALKEIAEIRRRDNPMWGV